MLLQDKISKKLLLGEESNCNFYDLTFCMVSFEGKGYEGEKVTPRM